MAQFLKLNDLLTDDDYTVIDEEVIQAFLDHGLVPQHNLQKRETSMNTKTLNSLDKIPVPQHVADWLDKLSHGLFGLNYDIVPSEIYDWVYANNDNLKKLHLAVVAGYIVDESL